MKTKESVQSRIKFYEKKLIELKAKLEQGKNNLINQEFEWIKIPEKKIVITKLVYKEKTLSDIQKLLKKDEIIADYDLIQWLRNNDKYRDLLGLDNTWCFVHPNPDKISAKNNYVAWFSVNLYRAYLGCNGDPSYSNLALGVYIYKRIK